jgi:hypothetical protein
MSKRQPATHGGTPMITTTISLPEQEFLALKHLAVERRTTFRDLVREALAVLVKDAGKGSRR